MDLIFLLQAFKMKHLGAAVFKWRAAAQFNKTSEPCSQTRGDGLSLCFKLYFSALTNMILLYSGVLRAIVHKKSEFPKRAVSSWMGVPSPNLGVRSWKCNNLQMKSALVKHQSHICCFLFVVRQRCSAKQKPECSDSFRLLNKDLHTHAFKTLSFLLLSLVLPFTFSNLKISSFVLMACLFFLFFFCICTILEQKILSISAVFV